ncbi:MAG: molybdopterin-guanine dinucleotide biosynthesis protein B [Candidatus Thermoplasmatota archaeon]|nr:molybdopterin-guanine dinucleotide biosynthesis protein B [Candidatus Thermoplasmatota archaeon]MBU4071904.1 molybdopterin-guanine dinucleotide biosynthesis protein B [Candidatus Thermoplasmatota archaeon]MBU4144776.1 molybdopterin-guanine dinucleotide biosynthesis protein B [Candidatus Thermoplasmatota archaeon]MBU4592226.1 molybdopterin-guanine dinucleotide biosynthesis protein B [Candidatus Thermoplasmatota archaeon]
MIIVSLIGLKKTGKTTCVEALVREFKSRGMKVGTVKSMVSSKFTIDTEGKDTWRHQEAGADFVVSLSMDEIAYIEKRPSRSRLDEFIRFIPEDTDILICEGLEDTDHRIIRILVAKSTEFLAETFEVRGAQENVIALTGIVANEITDNEDYPVFNCTVSEETRALADLILENSV